MPDKRSYLRWSWACYKLSNEQFYIDDASERCDNHSDLTHDSIQMYQTGGWWSAQEGLYIYKYADM